MSTIETKYDGAAYANLIGEIYEKAECKHAVVFVLEGNEGTGVARKVKGSGGTNFIQDAIEAKAFSDMLLEMSQLYEREAHEFLSRAKQAGQFPTDEQLDRAFPVKGPGDSSLS